MQITLSRVVEAARQRKAAVTAEASGYIILLAVQRLAAQPRRIDADLIQVSATGEILIEASASAPMDETEAALRRLLATLMSLSHHAPPALRAAAERAPVGTLSALESELTAALIPINHAASGRALARLFRETDKALRSPSSEVSTGPVSVSQVSASAVSPSPVSARAVSLSPVSLSPVGTEERGTPLPVLASPLEASPLEIDVDVVAGDDEDEELAAPATSGAAPSAAAVVSALATPAPSDAPQLIVEELDESDVQELDAEDWEPFAAAALAGSAPLAVVAWSGSAEERAAEAHEVADDLDVLLAADLPPPLTPLPLLAEQGLEASLVSGDVVRDDEAAARILSDSVFAPLADTEPEPPPQRSDLHQLLDGFLAHTRCEENMTANLRRMIGLEPWRSPGGVAGPKMGA